MGKLLMVVVAGLWSLSWLGISLARGWGTTIDLWLDPGDCPQPCWRGIQPGTNATNTFLETARRSNRYRPYIRYGADDVTINMMRLDPYGEILLGDVMLALGEPTHARLRYVAINSPQGRAFRVGASLYYGNGLVEVIVVRDDNVTVFSPHMQLRRIDYYAPNEAGSIIPLNTPHWAGFGTGYVEP